MKEKIKVLDGKYNYLQGAHVYSQETFSVLQEEKVQGNIFFVSEVKSHLKTGEVLYVNVDYQVNYKFEPISVHIKRRLGPKQSHEIFEVDLSTKTIEYSFNSKESSHSERKNLSGKPHFVTPCFLTSMIMLNSKTTTSIKRTQYNLISSNNIWEYNSPLEERVVYAQAKNLEPIEIKMGKSTVKSSHYSFSEESADQKESNDFYLSRYFFIPYKAIFKNEMSIEVESLKTYENEYKKMF